MKKFFAVFVCIFIVCGVFAEEPVKIESYEYKQDEILFKVGMVPYLETIYSCLVHMHDSEPLIPFPVLTSEYLHYVNPKNAIGSSLTLGCPVVGFSKSDWNTIYSSLRFTYRRIYKSKEKIKLYGEVGMGAELFYVIGDRESFTPFVSAAISPFGILFDYENHFFTTELTFGSEGSFVTVGFGKRF